MLIQWTPSPRAVKKVWNFDSYNPQDPEATGFTKGNPPVYLVSGGAGAPMYGDTK